MLGCIPHERMRKAWSVDLAANDDELPKGSVLLQERPDSKLGGDRNWIVVGRERGRVLLEPTAGTRDNMLPGDRFFRMS